MDDRTIYTDDGIAIPWFDKQLDFFLDKTSLIFGGSGSGKTTIIEEILYIIKDHVPNYLVICPPTSSAPYSKKLPNMCIKEDFTKALLQEIWTRQVGITQLYKNANDPEILQNLFAKAPDRQTITMINAITSTAIACINKIENNSNLDFAAKKSQTTAIKELRRKRTIDLYKSAIRKNKEVLAKSNLSMKERLALENIDLNPRFAIIIDDSSEKFKKWMKYFGNDEENVFEQIFYRCRHNFITLIFAAHDDKLVPTEFRKNARNTIFTSSQALVASLNKAQSGYTTQEKKDAMKMVSKIFGDSESRNGVKTHQKMCYIRESAHPFQYTIANLYPDFKLGSAVLQRLADKMPKGEDWTEHNPFINKEKKKAPRGRKAH